MEERLITHLDECLAAVEEGDGIESCLARYPDGADELAPLLRISLALESLPQPGPRITVTQAAMKAFLAEAERRRAHSRGGLVRIWVSVTGVWAEILRLISAPAKATPVRALATAVLALALAFLIGGGVIHAASGSLPGDPLYGFKLLGEDVQRALTLSEAGRVHLEGTFSARRVNEVRQLLTTGRREEVTFGGLLREQSGDQWHIDDIPVIVNADTRVQAEPPPLAFIEIHGITQPDGTVLALLIETEGGEIIGLIEAIHPGIWQIAGQHIRVNQKAYLENELQLGDCVEVHARRFPDGTLLALEVERTEGCQDDPASRGDTDGFEGPSLISPTTLTPGPPPSPTLLPTPSVTPIPEPTFTPSPTIEPDDDDDHEDEARPTWEAPPAPSSPPDDSVPVPTSEPDDDDDDKVGGADSGGDEDSGRVDGDDDVDDSAGGYGDDDEDDHDGTVDSDNDDDDDGKSGG